jgi:hypothetical protein
VRDVDETSRFLDEQYATRRDGDTLMIGNSTDNMYESGVITISVKLFKLTKGLWELLRRKNFNTVVNTPSDMKRYKRILQEMLRPTWLDTNPEATYRSVGV